MTNLDKQLEELIKERNDFEAENIALKVALKTIHDMCFVECDVEFDVKAAFELCVNTLRGDNELHT